MSSHHRHPGIAQFPRPVPVDVEVLGLAFDVTIGRHQVTVTLPVLEGEAQFTPPPDRLGRLDRLIAPPDVTGEALPKALLRTSTDAWGYRSTQRICYVEAVAISPILEHEQDVLDEPVRDLGNKFFTWFRIFQEWACAWSGEPMQDFDPYRPSAVHVVDDQGEVISNGPRERGVYVWPRPLNRDQVAGAMRRASAGELLPPEHRTLLEAVEAKIGAMPRKAVVDAATAVEVAMGGYITRELTSRGIGASFIDEVIKGVNGLMNLHSLCTELGADPGVSRNKLGAQLANVRNRAAHAGVRPTWAEVKAACDHAATIVHAITPLPEA